MERLIEEVKRMQQLAGILKESQLVTESNDVVTNYTQDRETDKAVLVKIPYVTNNGDEKSLSVWVSKSTLQKSNGVPTWMVQKHLETLRDKGYRYDIGNIMRTLGKTATDVAKSTKESTPIIVWDFYVDVKNIPGASGLEGREGIPLTQQIKQAKNREAAQQIIDQIRDKLGVDKLQLKVHERVIERKKEERYKEMDPFKFNNVITKEDRLASKYYKTPEHRRTF